MRILITGGAGFIGCNLAAACIRAGHQVTIYDNLSRRGSSANLTWLKGQFGDSFAIEVASSLGLFPELIERAKSLSGSQNPNSPNS